MSGFGDISRMKLSELGKNEPEPDSLDTGADIEGTDGIVDTDMEHDGSAAEVVDTKERMAAPRGQYYCVDADISPKEMRSFLFAHNYRQPIMVVATLIGIIWPIYTVLQQKQNVMIALVIMALFVIIMPVNLWMKGGTNVKNNPAYQNTFHYMLDEAGVHLELAEKAVDVEWNRIYKSLFLKSSVVLYTGKVNAYLIPTKDMGSKKDEIIRFIKEHVK